MLFYVRISEMNIWTELTPLDKSDIRFKLLPKKSHHYPTTNLKLIIEDF